MCLGIIRIKIIELLQELITNRKIKYYFTKSRLSQDRLPPQTAVFYLPEPQLYNNVLCTINCTVYHGTAAGMRGDTWVGMWVGRFRNLSYSHK